MIIQQPPYFNLLHWTLNMLVFSEMDVNFRYMNAGMQDNNMIMDVLVAKIRFHRSLMSKLYFAVGTRRVHKMNARIRFQNLKKTVWTNTSYPYWWEMDGT